MNFLRRIIHSIGLGRGTTAATDGGNIRTVQLAFPTTAAPRDAVPFMQHYGFASRPHANCDYVAVAPPSETHRPDHIVIIASNDQHFQISLIEGESALHDDLGQAFHVTRGGLVQKDQFGNSLTSSSNGWNLVDVNGNGLVTGPNGVTITSCTGIVYVNNEIANTQEGGTGVTTSGIIKSLQDVIANVGAAQVALATHKHSDAGGTGNSGPPVPGT